ncbi:reelin domain-containing protein 1-like [Pristis pectinata]|uniref:reelin domain-containing protein 1-like n=1 Tax=Pristis pectinata TaxID=685728 RepID=UPI00223DD753|nr:reelin domain-containing protein 1-like [Pristis pectinata]
MVGSLCLISLTSGFSHGASPSACADMKPKHISAHSQDPRSSFITVHTNKSTYLPGDEVPVTVRSTRDFMGFMMQARRVADDQVAGTFILISTGSKLLKCFEDGDTVTHSDKSLKRNLSFVWKAPDQLTGDIKFFVSAVQSYFTYWSRIESDLISDQKQNYSMLTKNEELMETLQASVYNNTTVRTTPSTEASTLPPLKFTDFINPQAITQMMQEFSQTPVITKEWSLRSQATNEENYLSKVDQNLASEQSSLVLGENDRRLQPSLNSINRGKLTALLSTDNSFLLKTLELEATGSNNNLNTESHFNLPSLSCISCSNNEQIATWTTSTVVDLRSSDAISGQDYSTFWSASFSTGEEKEWVSPDMEDYKNRAGEATILGTGPFSDVEDIYPTGTIKQLVSHLASANFLQSSKDSGSKVNVGKIVRNMSVRVTPPEQKDNSPGSGNGAAKGAELGIPQLGILLGCSAALGMALAVGMRHFFSQHCRKRTEVSFRDPDSSVLGVGDSGELVHVRKIRENSFVLVQAEYNVINPPITVGK